MGKQLLLILANLYFLQRLYWSLMHWVFNCTMLISWNTLKDLHFHYKMATDLKEWLQCQLIKYVLECTIFLRASWLSMWHNSASAIRKHILLCFSVSASPLHGKKDVCFYSNALSYSIKASSLTHLNLFSAEQQYFSNLTHFICDNNLFKENNF